ALADQAVVTPQLGGVWHVRPPAGRPGLLAAAVTGARGASLVCHPVLAVLAISCADHLGHSLLPSNRFLCPNDKLGLWPQAGGLPGPCPPCARPGKRAARRAEGAEGP